MRTVTELVRRAHSDVVDAGIEDTAAFAAALRTVLTHYLATEPIEGAAVPRERAMVPAAAPADDRVGSPEDLDSTVGRALGIAADAVSSVFTIDEETVALEVPVAQLPTVKAQAAREVSLAVAAVNHALSRETRTSAIRAILQEYGRFDSGNFMTEVRNTPQEYLAVKGKPNTRDHQLIVRRPGMEEAGRIILRWSGYS